MTTIRQIEANRRNAARSTGPRTAGGKSQSSKNALRHGLSIPVSRNAELRRELNTLIQCMLESSGIDNDEARAIATYYIERKRLRIAREVEFEKVGDPEQASSSTVAGLVEALESILRYDIGSASKRRRAVRNAIMRKVSA